MNNLLLKFINVLKSIKPEHMFSLLYGSYFFGMFFIFTTMNIGNFKYIAFFQMFLIFFVYPLCLLANLFLFKTYTVKKFLLHLILSLLFVFAVHKSGMMELIHLWFMLLCTPPLEFKKIVGIIYKFLIVAVPLVMFFAITGGTYHVMYPRTEGIVPFMRYSFGFTSPNFMGAFLLEISLCLAYLKWGVWNNRDKFIMVVCLIIASVFCNCRTVALLMLAVFLLIVFYQSNYKEKIFSFIKYFSYFSLFFCPIFSFSVAVLYGYGCPIAFYLNELILHRFRNLCYSMHFFDINLFGNGLKYTFDMLNISNAYGYLLIGYGMIAFIFLLAAYFFLIKKSIEVKNIAMLSLVTLYLYYGISEFVILLPIFNMTLFALSKFLNNNVKNN